jgi:NADP-dependent 3-hydroxy acid dehydrogenase YdfG
MATLKNKVVLITGASSGFGEDAARLFAREGASVVVAARRIDRLQELVATIQAEGGEAMAVPVDLNNRADIENMIKTVIENYERIDILFNNAGFGRMGYLETLDPERDIETQIQVNLIGLIETTRFVLPIMLAQKSGQIINMSSIAGWIATPMYSVYAASKFGVRGFTDGLRREVAPYGIKVSGIYPGGAATEFASHTGSPLMHGRFSTPKWMRMTSEYVARKVVSMARWPRRTMILPPYMFVSIWFAHLFPGVIDLAGRLVVRQVAKK